VVSPSNHCAIFSLILKAQWNYDLKKLRGKDLMSRRDNSRRYSVAPQAIRIIAALVILREKVLRPILAGVGKPRMGRKPKT